MPPNPRGSRLAHCLAVVLVLTAAGAQARGDAAVPARGEAAAFRAKLEKWVETRQLLSEERAEWAVERETLEATQALLAEQKEELAAKAAAAESETTEAEEARRDLLLSRAAYQRANAAIEQRLIALERKVLALAKRLPPPLVDRIEPLLVQIPADPEPGDGKLGQRLVNVLGVLSQAEQWNATAHLIGETREIETGERVSTRTLYWGLGQAFYVAAGGRTAGVGRPGDDGWSFVGAPDLADDAGRLIDIYEGVVDTIEFVPLPVEVGHRVPPVALGPDAGGRP